RRGKNTPQRPKKRRRNGLASKPLEVRARSLPTLYAARARPRPSYTPVGRGRSNSGRAFAGYVGNLTHVSTLFCAWEAPMPYPDLLTLARDLRVRAEEISTRAKTFHNADAKQKMREIAATYVKLAERLEQHTSLARVASQQVLKRDSQGVGCP